MWNSAVFQSGPRGPGTIAVPTTCKSWMLGRKMAPARTAAITIHRPHLGSPRYRSPIACIAFFVAFTTPDGRRLMSFVELMPVLASHRPRMRHKHAELAD